MNQMNNVKSKLRNLFFPPQGSPRWMLILPYGILGILVLSLLVGGAYVWDYTNSPPFCGTTCHTMPPEYAAYQVSPHARVACVECHIGREFIGNQIFRKAGDIKHVVAVTFGTYEYPITIKSMRPAREICEKCHSPEKFSDDSLRIKSHYTTNEENTPYSTYLILKTGGGSKRIGLGRGIHWHIENPVYYYATDVYDQVIPYIKVMNDDGTSTEYVDIESGVTVESIDENNLKQMDCITCHNRITHRVYSPTESVENSITRGVIAADIPYIRYKGVEFLTKAYANNEEALSQIATNLDGYYKDNYPDYYSANKGKIDAAIAELQRTYSESVFPDQKVDWTTHPNNVGHINSPGCFRCHDGKHLSSKNEAIRLECNLCHSVPVVSGAEDFVTDIEISHGSEPPTHLNSNWIAMHNRAFDVSCAACHNTDDPGGTSNTSFCSNSACHGSAFTYAGFDAPQLRKVVESQLPPPAPTPAPMPVVSNPTYDANISPLFSSKCGACHGGTAAAGLNLTTYADLMKGSKNGAVITPGDSANSVLIKVQSAKHRVNFDETELAMVKKWIDLGAPEK